MIISVKITITKEQKNLNAGENVEKRNSPAVNINAISTAIIGNSL